eukprot:TRINITY_DN196_c0_g1_i9.p1 TRINITY_DN196_c0_g1~~TRINITY_DN196_c0_g1_i9.p1  ORF type:complete len:551 (+),score=89.03 TRINITY_DN196_c0_g1_i9:772-2424(+)
MFSTGGSGSVKCGREVLAAKTEISALGIKVCMDGEHRAKPLVGMERACGRLAAMPLGFSQKARIISSSILPSCLYGVAYAPPSKVDAGTIRSRVATCLWGPKFKMRSPCAVANILLPGHTTDPLVVTLYRLLCTVVKVGRSDAELWDRMGRCAALYLQSDVEAQGPVGTLVRRWLPAVGKSWSFVEGLRTTTERERKHEIRRVARAMTAAEQAEGRTSYSGMPEGADPVTNGWWRALANNPMAAYRLRRLIAGAVFAVYPAVRGVAEGPDNPLQHLCDVCGERYGSYTEVLEHALWRCELGDAVRGKAEYASLDPATMPNATALHGIVPRGCQDKPRALLVQRYLLEVVTLRDTAVEANRALQTQTYPWRVVVTGRAHPTPTVAELRGLGASGKVMDRLLGPVLRWLSGLLWDDAPGRHTTVTTLELALDFERETELPLDDGGGVGKVEDLGVKARRLRYVLRRVQDLYHADGRRTAFPAARVDRVNSLRCIGGPTTHGYDRRPVLPERTMSSIEGLRDTYLSQTPTRLPRSFTTAVGTRQSPQNGDNGD